MVMLVLRRGRGALLALAWLAFAISFCGKLCGLLFLLCKLLVFDVLGCLICISRNSDIDQERIWDLPLAMPRQV